MTTQKTIKTIVWAIGLVVLLGYPMIQEAKAKAAGKTKDTSPKITFKNIDDKYLFVINDKTIIDPKKSKEIAASEIQSPLKITAYDTKSKVDSGDWKELEKSTKV